MKDNVISENVIKEMIDKVITEEVSKVKREEFNRVQFKLDELQNSLNETFRELRKLEDSIPSGLKSLTNGKISGISNNLSNADKLLSQLKSKIREHKRNTYSQQVVEKKK